MTTYMIVEIFSGEKEMKSVVKILCSGNSLPWTDKSIIGVHSVRRTTYNPMRAPMASAKEQACCLAFSSCVPDSFPLCFSERNPTSEAVKYG
jgi:hypothetical protein